MKINYRELFGPIIDFYKLKTLLEKVIYIGVPLFVGSLYLLSLKIFTVNDGFEIDSFTNDFNNALITVLALFISFSIAYLTILISSSSDNINELKQSTSKVYKLDGKPIFLFQILLTEMTYAIIIEMLALVLAFLQKFLVVVSSNYQIKMYLFVNIILITHIILLIMRNVKNIYYSFWKSR